jgi:hypothetical protein
VRFYGGVVALAVWSETLPGGHGERTDDPGSGAGEERAASEATPT